MLTPKQEQFVKNIVLEQMNYTEAYRNAYNAENMSDKTISEKGNRFPEDYDSTTESGTADGVRTR